MSQIHIFATDDDTDARLDELITFAQAAGELPCRRKGRPTKRGTLYHWAKYGVRGRTLRFVQVGATRCTTRRWLREFFDELTADIEEDMAENPAPMTPRGYKSPAKRKKLADQINREMDERQGRS